MTGLTGVLPLIKPPGPSSQQVVRAVADLAGRTVRAGHAGTLDPAAAGVLEIGLGRATRLLPFLQGGEKHYRFDLVLGIATDTQDGTGQVTQRRDAGHLTAADVEGALAEHVGRIPQRAPLYSARRVDGQRLYAYARQGEAVAAPEFVVTIHAVRLLDFRPGTVAIGRCDLRCGPGTYVRALAASVGERLGCGAHAGMLLRLASGWSRVADCHTLEEVTAAARAGRLDTMVRTPADALGFLPARRLTATEAAGVRHGIPPAGGPVAGSELLRLLGPDGQLLAVASATPQGLRLRCVLADA